MTQTVQLPARFANRQNRRSIVQHFTAGLGAQSPPYVSIKGGSFTLVDANGEQEPVETKHLDCVIFDMNLDVPIQRVFWGLDERNQPKGFDNNSNIPPECWSDNGIGASANAPNPQSQSCQTCPMARFDWVSKRDAKERRTACGKIKKVAVVPVEGKLDGMTYVVEFVRDFPFLLRIPVMSHKNARIYGDKFKGQDFDLSEVVTRISFVHGEVGLLDFEAVGMTDQATEDLIQKFLTSRVTDNYVGRGDVPWRGEVKQIALAPVAQPTPPAPTPFSGGQAEQAPKTRTRRTKAQMEADAVAPPPLQGVQGGGIPGFLQRQPVAGAPAAPSHGIQQNAPAPNAELEGALASVFGLKT